jgi:hypothetical protein
MFTVHRRDIADVEPFIRLPGAASLAFGSVAKLVSGSLAKAGATDMPTHVIMGPRGDDGMYPVIKILPTTEFATEASATVAATLVGQKVTLNTDALSVTATTSSGVFTIDSTDGDKAVTGHFSGVAAAV